MNQPTKAALSHVATAGGAAVATAMFLASKGVDLYAIIDQINVVVADITKLIALITPIAAGAYAAWKKTTKENMTDAVTAPNAAEVAKALPVTPETVIVADALKTNGH